MKRKAVAGFLLLALFSAFGTVHAATTIDLIPESSNVNIGEPIFIDVVLTTDYPSGIMAGTLDFTYADALVSYVGSTFDAASAHHYYIGFDDTTGNIDDWTFQHPSFSGLEGGPMTLATLEFSSDAPGTANFEAILQRLYPNNLPGWYAGNNNSILDLSSFTSGAPQSVTINAVPIPGALILLSSGLFGLMGIKRKFLG